MEKTDTALFTVKIVALLAATMVLALCSASCAPEQSGGPTDTGSSTAKAPGAPTTVASEDTGQAVGEASGEPVAQQSRKADREGRPRPEQALVPVAHLTFDKDSVTRGELSRNKDLAVPKDSEEAAEQLLGDSELQSMKSASAVVEHVSQSPGAVGLVPWDELTPQVKALAVEGESILEDGTSEDYPLRANDAELPDPEKLRRVVIGGDVVMDRGMPYAVLRQNKGMEFPLDGGYVAITERTPIQSEASEFGVIHKFEAQRRGESGAVREYLNSADLMLANLENPIVEDASWHPDAPTFTGDPRLLPVLEDAGLDGVTLANNHIMDAGASGISETREYLRKSGIFYTGAGANLEAAREPMIFELGGIEMGVLSYQGVPYYEWLWATGSAPGTAPLRKEVMVEDIKELEDEVDVVAVMPHWGKEYTATPEPEQVELAHAATEAGADLVVGGHAHWPKGIEIKGEKPIFYGTGNFLFDQSWSLETSTGIFAEITLYEDRVIQEKTVPFVMLDRAQPNFLASEGGGEKALDTVYDASLGEEFEAYE